MNWQTYTSPLGGMRIIVDKNCFTTKVTYRAVAVVVDVRRPNKVKPIYKLKRFEKKTPIAYLVKGLGLVVHPSIYAEIQKKLRDSVIEQERNLFMTAFGAQPQEPQPKGLTLSDLQDAIKKIDGLT